MSDQLPPPQAGPHTWRSSDFGDPSEWAWHLSEAEISELLAAAAPYEFAEASDLTQITAKSFQLPSVRPRLEALRRRLTHGRGFDLIRGFPCTYVSEALAAAVFVGVGAHLGSLRSQNAAGDLLGHVKNVGLSGQDNRVRIYQTNERQTFHTDSADVVGLLCLETAASGGDSLLVSATTVYNEMAATDASLAACLFEPIATDRRGEVPDGAEPFFRIPVLSWYDGELSVMYQRQYIESAQRFQNAPPLTAKTEDALDLFDEIANQPTVHLRMGLEVGDMQFVHNHSLLHDRTGYVDKPDSARHLLRLWLSVPEDRALPPVFAERLGSVVVGDRGGIRVAD